MLSDFNDYILDKTKFNSYYFRLKCEGFNRCSSVKSYFSIKVIRLHPI